MPSLIAPLKGSLPDEILLRKSSAALVLAMARTGMITIDDMWEPADPRSAGDFTREWGVPTPRGLLWAWRNHSEGPAKETVPSAKLWDALAQEDPDAPSAILADHDRLMAWMFSDPRVWTTGPLRPFIHVAYASPLDWALGNGVTWALDAALRQPNRPSIEKAWWEAALVDCVMRDTRDMLETLMAHSPVRLADIRVAVSGNLNQGTGTAEASSNGQGYPLLHLVSDPRTAQILIEGGVDVLAVDAHGRTADEHWKVRGSNGSEDNRYFEKRMRDDCLVVFERAIKQLPSEGTVRIRQRQDLHTFTTVDAATFEAWLAQQPTDLTLGEQRWLPNQALANTTATAAELAKRAGWLFRHQSSQALDRVGDDGIKEREALWWAVAAGGIKVPFPHLKKAWKDVLEPDAWLDLLDTGEALLARNRPGGSIPLPPVGLTEAALGLFTKAVAAVTDTRLIADPNLDQMTPTSPNSWENIRTRGLTPLDQCMRMAAEGLRTDRSVPLSHYSGALFALEEWLREHPMDERAQPRHLMLENCLTLFAHGTRVGQLNVIDARETDQAMGEGAFLSMHSNATSLALLACSHHLMAAGAQVSELALHALETSDSGRHPVGQSVIAALRQHRMEQRLSEPAERPSRRPRM